MNGKKIQCGLQELCSSDPEYSIVRVTVEKVHYEDSINEYAPLCLDSHTFLNYYFSVTDGFL